MSEKIRLSQIAYTSEWALAKFFSAILSDAYIQERFELVSICGREETKVKAISRLKKAIKDRAALLTNGDWRSAQRSIEIGSLVELMDELHCDKIKYYQVNENDTLPGKVYKNCDAVVIHSISPSHYGYIEDAINNGKNVLCEKPLVPILDGHGNPDDREIDLLERIVNDNPVLMDAEHYSYKMASLIFYENLNKLLDGKKIKEVEGELKEIDDPGFWRTRKILSPSSMIGLLGDTGIHLEAFISCLGGEQEITGVKYDIYQDDSVEYYVDTYSEVEFRINGEHFTDNTKGKFTVAKFIDKFVEKEKEESKYIKLTLEDDSEIVINFKEGKVTKSGRQVELVSKYIISKNEYVNILNHFYAAIINGVPPITDVRNSLKSLRFLHQAYSFDREKIEVYQDGTGC